MPRALFRGQLISTLWKDPGIRALLLRHLVEVPELGYCEGMHLVAAVFSKASSSHDEAWDAHVASGRQASRYFRWVHNLKLWQKKTALVRAPAQEQRRGEHVSATGIDDNVHYVAALGNRGGLPRSSGRHRFQGNGGYMSALGAAASSLLPDISKTLPRPPPTPPKAASPKPDCSCTEARSPKRHRSYREEPHAGSITERNQNHIFHAGTFELSWPSYSIRSCPSPAIHGRT